MIENDGQKDVDTLDLKIYPCEDKDFENFYPPSKTAVTKFNLLKEKKKLMCIETQD